MEVAGARKRHGESALPCMRQSLRRDHPPPSPRQVKEHQEDVRKVVMGPAGCLRQKLAEGGAKALSVEEQAACASRGSWWRRRQQWWWR